MKAKINCFKELDLETKFWIPFVCGTGTETFLVYFRTGANLHKSKELPNTGFKYSTRIQTTRLQQKHAHTRGKIKMIV
jgi:hypothetical protein